MRTAGFAWGLPHHNSLCREETLFLLQAGDTPLHIACRKKHVNIVELLLGKFGANIHIKNKVFCTSNLLRKHKALDYCGKFAVTDYCPRDLSGLSKILKAGDGWISKKILLISESLRFMFLFGMILFKGDELFVVITFGFRQQCDKTYVEYLILGIESRSIYIPYILTLVCKLSLLLSKYFLWYLKGELS